MSYRKMQSLHPIRQIILLFFIVIFSVGQSRAQDAAPTEAEFEVIGSTNAAQLTQLKSWQPDDELLSVGIYITPSDGSDIFLVENRATNVIGTINADSLSSGLTYQYDPDGLIANTAISPDGQFAAVSGLTTIDVWDTGSGELKFRLEADQHFEAERVQFSPDSRLFAYGYVNGQAPSEKDGVYVIDLESGKQIHFFAQIAASEFAFSPDSQSIALGDTSGEVRIWNLQDSSYTQLRPPDNKILTQVSYVDSKTLAVAFWTNRGRGLEFWDITQSQELNTTDHGELSFYYKDGIVQTHSDDFTAIQLWTVSDNKDLALLKGLSIADMNVEENLVITSSKEGEIQFLYLDTGELIGTLDESISDSTYARLSFDKRHLIVWGDDGQVQLWGIPKTSAGN